MNFLDVRTVMFSHVVTDAICTAVLAFVWVQNRKRFAGMSCWVLDFAFQTAAATLIGLRGTIPAWVSMVVSNTLVVSGAFLGYVGLTRFFGRRRPQIHNDVVLAAFLAVHLYFVFVQPNLAARNLNVSLGLLVMCVQCMWLGLRRKTPGVGLVFGAFCLVSVVRITAILVNPPASNDFFRSGFYDTLLLMAYQLLLILLTFALTITINLRLLEEVRTQEEKFTKAFRSSPYAVTLTRASDGQIVDVNDGFVAITGYSSSEATGRTMLEMQLWAREVDRAEVVRLLSEGSRLTGREYQFRKKSGELITGLCYAEIISIDHQPWILASIHDITERKRAEAERERLMAAIEQAAEAVIIADPEGTISYVNPAFEAVTGYSRSEAIGRNPRLLKSSVQDNAFYAQMWETISSGKSWHGTLVNKRKDGKLYTEHATISPVSGANGRIVSYVAVKRDISAQLLMEDQLRQAQKMESVGLLAGGVAHDFNNMLQIITSHVDILLGKVEAGHPPHTSLLAIGTAAQHSAEITRQLLAFARKQAASPKVLDLNEAVAGLRNTIQRLVGDDIDLRWTPGRDLWHVRIDPAQLDQILSNLAVNARDATGGSGTLTIETKNFIFDEEYCAAHSGSVAGDYVMLAASDNGRGMDKETLSHVFEPFFTTKGLGNAAGLGLATVYGIVKQNSGFIDVWSERGQGTTFKMYLRRAEAAPPAG